MKNRHIFFLILVIAFVSCKEDKNELLAKKWKTLSIDNSTQRKQEEYYRQLMDTLTDKNEMVAFFGSVDSFKKVIVADMAEQEEVRKLNMENSFIEFKKNNIVYFISTDGQDSSKWKIEDNDIVIEDADLTGLSAITRLTILKLTKDRLSVKMINQTDTSLIELKASNN